MELETQWIIAYRLGYLDEVSFTGLQARMHRIGMMLNRLIHKLSGPSGTA